ncbi:response regulator transcription factor [Halotalea alkalilenta]|uniref:Two-component system response regulator n=1 Tax=Halotalea alkalilenta TaxID=376489 RepID=A0A172YD31_9GAMM|nr:response regulator transcription factor [Halotalea alkalilenta]ANF57159.1 two-component system response regulator [Halotalea alkalilenta]
MINKTKVLIVEDNTELAENLYEFLGEEQYELDLAQGGMTALHLLDTQVYDVVVLDVMIPGLSGFDICRKLRKDMNNQTPIIFMTAKGAIEDKEEGYLSGGDDYLVKPFPLRELALRINALHRRRHHDTQRLCAKSLTFNPGNLEVRLNGGQALALSGLAAHIFEALIRSYPDFVSYDSLSSRLWPERDVDANTLRTHIYMLRKQLQDAYGHSLIKTLHGRGYILTPPDVDQAES